MVNALMRGRMKQGLALLFGLLIAVSYTSMSADQTRVRFSIGEWTPYTGEKMTHHGMAAEIVTAACLAVGLQTEFEFFPWKRAEMNVANGSHFGTFPYKNIHQRNDIYTFSEELFTSSFSIVIHRGNPKTANFKYSLLEDFRSYTVGIVAGTDAIRLPLEKSGVTVEAVAGAEQNLKKLKFGRIDVYIDDKAVIYQALRNHFKAVQAAEFVLAENDFGGKNEFRIMISRKYPNSREITAQINAGLKEIKANGEHQKILARYCL